MIFCTGKKPSEERAISESVSRGTVTEKGGEEGSETAAGRNSYCATDAQRKSVRGGVYSTSFDIFKVFQELLFVRNISNIYLWAFLNP